MVSGLTFENPIFANFAFYAALCIGKMMLMSFLTARVRLTKRIFANDEDIKFQGSPHKATTSDPDVERVRRCHLNDIENIVPFVLLGALYTLTEPNAWWALLRFRVFAASRIFHTIAYLTPLPQPSRGLSFTVGTVINISMLVPVLMRASY